MTTPNVFIKVGTTMAKVQQDRVDQVRAELVKASKVPTTKQARARALMGGVTRSYPKFEEGMSTAEYVAAYYLKNTGVLSGTFFGNKEAQQENAQSVIADFFQPLSTAMQYADVDTTVEEFMS